MKKIKKKIKKKMRKLLILILVLALVSLCVYLISYFNSNSSGEPSSSEPVSSEPLTSNNSVFSSNEDESGKRLSTIETYTPDSEDVLNPDNGGLSSDDLTTIQNTVFTYYASVLETYKGETLWTELHSITVPVTLTSYNDLRYDTGVEGSIGGNPTVDYASNDKTKVIDFYTGAIISNEWDPNDNWNREHVWCQSHGWWGEVTGSKRNGGSDLHHLRPELKSINSSRNNSLYGELDNREQYKKEYEVDGQDYVYGYLNGKIDGRLNEGATEGVFEPTDRMKGDVARIIMYLLVRYKDVCTPITNIIYTPSRSEEAALDLLVKWHENDPVSNFEIRRNHKTYEIQGNRNPFIDYPGFARDIFMNK